MYYLATIKKKYSLISGSLQIYSKHYYKSNYIIVVMLSART